MTQSIQNDQGDLKEPGSSTTHTPEGGLVVVFYNSRADIGSGRAWVPVLQSLPVNLEGGYYCETTARGNGILLFRSSGTNQQYELLASHQRQEVLAKYGENTFLGRTVLDRLRKGSANVDGLRVLTEHEERLLLNAIQHVVGRNGLTIP
jgi:hypothetical protein